MHRTATADTTVAVDRLFGAVSDLSTYPSWVDAVQQAVPQPGSDAAADPCWFVTLRAAVGPFARSKRLRIERTSCTDREALERGTGRARFERRELDGRDHAPWVLEVTCEQTPAGSRVSMDLHYGGRLWTSALDGVLDRQIERALDQLPAYLA